MPRYQFANREEQNRDRIMAYDQLAQSDRRAANAEENMQMSRDKFSRDMVMDDLLLKQKDKEMELRTKAQEIDNARLGLEKQRLEKAVAADELTVEKDMLKAQTDAEILKQGSQWLRTARERKIKPSSPTFLDDMAELFDSFPEGTQHPAVQEWMKFVKIPDRDTLAEKLDYRLKLLEEGERLKREGAGPIAYDKRFGTLQADRDAGKTPAEIEEEKFRAARGATTGKILTREQEEEQVRRKAFLERELGGVRNDLKEAGAPARIEEAGKTAAAREAAKPAVFGTDRKTIETQLKDFDSKLLRSISERQSAQDRLEKVRNTGTESEINAAMDLVKVADAAYKDYRDRVAGAKAALKATGSAAPAPNAAALKWLEENPDDERAPAIRAKLGIQ